MIFEEEAEPIDELQGTFGLLSPHGVPKPGWEAFRLLHLMAGDTILPTQLDPPWVKQGAVDSSQCRVGRYQGCFNNLAPEPPCCHPMKSGCQGCGNSACQMSSYASSTLAAAVGKNNTPSLCMQLCARAGWSFFGLQENTCRCGNADWKTPGNGHSGCTALPAASCSTPCPGNVSATCGDGDKHTLDVYAIECPDRATPPHVVAFATTNHSTQGAGGVSIFVSFWHDAGPSPPPQRLALTVTVPKTASGDAPWVGAAALYRIDGHHAHAVDAWHKMGQPATPSAAQLAELQHASQCSAEPLEVSFDEAKEHATMEIDAMPANSAYVVHVS